MSRALYIKSPMLTKSFLQSIETLANPLHPTKGANAEIVLYGEIACQRHLSRGNKKANRRRRRR